jgi:hypothetical protein
MPLLLPFIMTALPRKVDGRVWRNDMSELGERTDRALIDDADDVVEAM